MEHSSWITVSVTQSQEEAVRLRGSDATIAAPAVLVESRENAAGVADPELETFVVPLIHATTFDALPREVPARLWTSRWYAGPGTCAR
jgi:hypothetical protein